MAVFVRRPKKVGIITRCPYYRGGRKAWFNCTKKQVMGAIIDPFTSRAGYDETTLAELLKSVVNLRTQDFTRKIYSSFSSLFRRGIFFSQPFCCLKLGIECYYFLTRVQKRNQHLKKRAQHPYIHICLCIQIQL